MKNKKKENTSKDLSRREENRIFLEFDSNFWEAYYSVLEQAVKMLNAMTGAKVELLRTYQHLGGQRDLHTGLEYRQYYHLRLGEMEWTIPISLYTPEVLAVWFAEKLDLKVKKAAPQKPVEPAQPANPLGTYLGEGFHAPALGDKLPFGSVYRPEGAAFQFRMSQRNPFDARGSWKKEPLDAAA